MVAGNALAEPRLGKLFIRVLAFAIGAFILIVVLQSVGLAPTVPR